ncbi:hypothetical protein AgCh_017544 [Apium graveolens]
MVIKENFKEKRIVANVNDSGVDRCMKGDSRGHSLAYRTKKGQKAAFLEAYLQPSKGVATSVQLPKETDLKTKKIKTMEDEEMIRILSKYLKNAKTMFPRAQINTKDDLDDDEQKKYKHKSSGSNPSHYSKTSDSKVDDKKKGKEDKKGRGDGKKRRKNGEGGEKKQNVQEVQDDFLPVSKSITYDDYHPQLAEKIVKVSFVSLGEVRIYYKDDTFILMNREVIDIFSTAELKRVISMMNARDSSTRMTKALLAERLRERNIRNAIKKDEREERKRKYAEEIEMFERRSNELKRRGLSKDDNARYVSVTVCAESMGAEKNKKPKEDGVSLIELFTPYQVRKHISSLKQAVQSKPGQSKPKTGKPQSMEKSMSESSCQLCEMGKTNFEPIPTYCMPCGARIKQNAKYYTAEAANSK